jgi:hypothetical protein
VVWLYDSGLIAGIYNYELNSFDLTFARGLINVKTETPLPPSAVARDFKSSLL